MFHNPPSTSPQHPPQADYSLDQVEEVAEINRAAARLAKKATAAYMAAHPGSRKFVAGAIGPTNKTLSVSPSVENPALRGITYDEVEQAYFEQARALYEGGVDLFLVETIFDTGNAKAAVYALERFFEEQVRGRDGGGRGGDEDGGGLRMGFADARGLWTVLAWWCAEWSMPGGGQFAAVTATPPLPTHPPTPCRTGCAHPCVHQRHHCGQQRAHAERADQRGVLEQRQPRCVGGGGHACSGWLVWRGSVRSRQALESHATCSPLFIPARPSPCPACAAKPLAIGLNCALGATDMKQYIANLSACADCFVFCYPNAGLPNAMGGYDQKGPEMAEDIRPFCEWRWGAGQGQRCGAAGLACVVHCCRGMSETARQAVQCLL